MFYNHFLKAALLSAAGALISPLAFCQAQIVNITNSDFESGSAGWSKFSPGGVSYGAAPSGADATFADGNVAYIQVGYLKLASNPGPSFTAPPELRTSAAIGLVQAGVYDYSANYSVRNASFLMGVFSVDASGAKTFLSQTSPVSSANGAYSAFSSTAGQFTVAEGDATIGQSLYLFLQGAVTTSPPAFTSGISYFAATGSVAVDNVNMTFTPSAVPEPETYALLLSGLAVVGAGLKRRKAIPTTVA